MYSNLIQYTFLPPSGIPGVWPVCFLKNLLKYGRSLNPRSKVSGYVIKFQDESLYIAGDTIGYEEVESALEKFNPHNTIVNGGGAKFTFGDPIVMNTEDILKLCHFAPFSKVSVVHLESVNHSQETR